MERPRYYVIVHDRDAHRIERTRGDFIHGTAEQTGERVAEELRMHPVFGDDAVHPDRWVETVRL